MKRKIIGIFICMLLIATAFPAVTSINKVTSMNNIDLYANPSREGTSELEQTQLTEKGLTESMLKQVLSGSMFFTENKGQYPDEVVFQTQVSGAIVYLCRDKIVTVFHAPRGDRDYSTANDDRREEFRGEGTQKTYNRSVIVTAFVGSNPTVTLKGEGVLTHYNNYFIGNDPSKWCTRVPNYESVSYIDLYPGVDLKYYSANNSLKYDFIVHPGVDPSVIQMKYSGVEQLEVLGNGDLAVTAKEVGFVEKKPVIYQEVNGLKHEINGEYSINETGFLNFQLTSTYDRRFGLVIDPALVYSTYLGGINADYGDGIAVDASGCAYIIGETWSEDFPIWNANDSSYNEWGDVFVTKLTASGNVLVYSTYLGGTNNDYGNNIAVDASGCAYITGSTRSKDFPTWNAYDSIFNEGYVTDVFVTKLSAGGDTLVYSTFLGGTHDDGGQGIAVDASGCAYITGSTRSSEFPTWNANDSSYNEGGDVFITKFSAAGDTLVYSTYLGGENSDEAYDIAVDADGYAYITGDTYSSNYPTYNAYDSSYNLNDNIDNYDAFVTKLSVAGDALVYSTYLGGTDNDGGRGIAVDSSSCAYITGYTWSTDFPTWNANDSSYNEWDDVFVTKFSAAGDTLVYSTYLGGNNFDEGCDIAVDIGGHAYITGFTMSPDFPAWNAYDSSWNWGFDAFITKLSVAGDTLIYNTFLGGTEWDSGSGIAVDIDGYVYISGSTRSTDFPTWNAYEWDLNSESTDDAFIVKLNIKIDLTLYIEDAIQSEGSLPVVNKAPGDVIDVVAVVKNLGESGENVFTTILPESSELEFEKCFLRNDFSDTDESNVLTCEQFWFGLATTIYLDPGISKHIVWRFRLFDSASPDPSFKFYSFAYVAAEFCSASQASFSLIDHPKSIIVTNRHLLFENYDHDQVNSLLHYLYQISNSRNQNCIIYYLDHYSDNARTWNQNVVYTNQSTANTVANEIDDLIENWADKSAIVISLMLGFKIKIYPYLVIVGSDETVPFYRVNFTNYATNGEEHYGINDLPIPPWGNDVGLSQDPVLDTYNNHYFLTDMKYADMDDTDWTKGSINLASGRIVGATAEDMKNLTRNALHSPGIVGNAVIGIDNYTSQLVNSLARLRDDKGLNILNDGNPATEIPVTFNRLTGWGANDLVPALNQGCCIFEHTHHGDYYVLICPDADIWSANQLQDPSLSANISRFNPFVVTDSCHTGVVTDQSGANWNPTPGDNLAWAFIHAGASGYCAQHTYGLIHESDILLSLFFDELIRDTGTQTRPVGTSLRHAIWNYSPSGSSWTDRDQVAVTEPILYGLPWMVIDPPNEHPDFDESEKNYTVNISKPKFISSDTYSITIEINVTDSTISQINEFDVINISGSSDVLVDQHPVIPKIDVPIILPKSAEIVSLSNVISYSTSIGNYNLPCYHSSVRPDPISWTNCSGLTGCYPPDPFWYSSSDFDYQKQISIAIPLAKYWPETTETYLCNFTKLELIYHSPIPAAVTDFSTDKPEYPSGETIHTSVTIENIGSETLTNLYVNLSVKDTCGETKTFAVSSPFDIQNGETETLQVDLNQFLPTGTYLLEADVTGSDTLASSSEFIHISSGEIVSFNHPDKVLLGNDIEFEILFKNQKQTSVEATGSISLYDPHDIQVADLASLPVTVAANSTASINILWNTLDNEPGEYIAAAMVTTEDEPIGPVSDTFSIVLSDTDPPTTIKTIGTPKFGSSDEWVTSSTEFNLTATDDLSGVDATYYQIWFNGVWAPWIEYIGNFSLSSEGIHYVKYYSVDNAGNVEAVHNQIHSVDDTAPSITIKVPYQEEALQDSVTFQSLVIDSCGVEWVKYSIREPGGAQGIVIDSTYEALNASSTTDDKWELLFDTIQLPDGYYVLYVNASDELGNEGDTTQNFSIRNWAVLEMLPNTPNSKAGRTIPVKFSLRITEAVDPAQPFVRNEELTIRIYDKYKPGIILQESTYGSKSTDYRIISLEEQYITNFKTLPFPKTYVVDIWRGTLLIGSFEFQTVK